MKSMIITSIVVGTGYLIRRAVRDRKVEPVEQAKTRPIEQDSTPRMVNVDYRTGPEGHELNRVDFYA